MSIPDKFIPLISDCTPSESERALKIPPNMMPAWLPSIVLSGIQLKIMWQEIGEKSGLNLSFESMDQLEIDLAPARMKLENEPQVIESMARFQ